jgi:hypothetical protein
MEIRVQSTGAVMFWNEFRDLLLAQNPSELITVAPQTEEWLNAHGADLVFEGPQATGGTVYQYSQRQGVEQIGAQWYTKHVLGPIFTGDTATQDEVDYKAVKDAERATNIRNLRTQLLKDCDWTQIADSTADKTAWATYRQALRDVPTQAGFPWEITWPTQP